MPWRELNGGPRAILAKIEKGQQDGLTLRAQVVRNEWRRIMRANRGGFTTGNFATGLAVAHITQTVPRQYGTAFQWVVYVGTNLRYHLFWEVGHHNLFTRKYERVETLRPATQNTMEEQQAAYARGLLRAVNS
jgi:hypothetical protein